jgi:hypothetical protein
MGVGRMWQRPARKPEEPEVQIVSGGVTNVGRVRTNNEDCFRIVEALNLFVLSDGMGGEAHGEIASALAVEAVVKHCQETENDPAMTIFGDMPAVWSEKTRRLSSAVHLANKSIYDSAQANPAQRGGRQPRVPSAQWEFAAIDQRPLPGGGASATRHLDTGGSGAQ